MFQPVILPGDIKPPTGAQWEELQASLKSARLTPQQAFHAGEQAFEQKSYLAAVTYFQQAAEDDYPEALNELGFCYEEGLGVSKDLVKAFDFYSRAAALDDSTGCFNLALFYKEGTHVAQSDALASHWFLQADKHGDDDAAYELACMHYFHRVPHSTLDTTKRWLDIAWKFLDEETQNKLLWRLDIKVWRECDFHRDHFKVLYHWFVFKEEHDKMLNLLKTDPDTWKALFKTEHSRLEKSPDDREFMRTFFWHEDVRKFFEQNPQHRHIAQEAHLFLAKCYLALGTSAKDEGFLAKAHEHLAEGTHAVTTALFAPSYQKAAVNSATQTNEPELSDEDKRKFHFFG